jgi:hypothetical protein
MIIYKYSVLGLQYLFYTKFRFININIDLGFLLKCFKLIFLNFTENTCAQQSQLINISV